MGLAYVVNHPLDAAHSLDSLSSVWDRPIRSTGCRVNRTRVEYMGQPIHSTTYLPHERRPDATVQFMIIESLAICGLWVPNGNGKQVAGLNNSLESQVGRPKP